MNENQLELDDPNETNPSKKTCVYINNSNLYYAIRRFTAADPENRRLDYNKLTDFFNSRQKSDFRFYHSKSPQKNDLQRGFYSFLETLGYNLVSLPMSARHPHSNPYIRHLNTLTNWVLEEFETSEKEIISVLDTNEYWMRKIKGTEKIWEEKGINARLSFDMANLANKNLYNEYVLIAGDEEFVNCVTTLQKDFDIKVTIAFFENECHTMLKKVADEFIDLGSNNDLFSIMENK